MTKHLGYKNKIISLTKLKKILKKLNSKKITVLCHGCFDIVHPGHLRHLQYAKSKSDILIVSVTADRFISKGTHRPHIPEKMRAENLAAYEIVDYVLIDNNEKPLSLLKEIKPTFFAKGFEYNARGLTQATKEEIKVVRSYNGKMLFTPGDIVFSSSALLNLSLPNMSVDKLIMLMDAGNISFNKLKKIIKNLKNTKIHVVGDTIIDTFTRTTMIGGQTKTPTLSFLYQNSENYLGGAGIVSKHLEAAGAKVEFTTVLGKDDLKDYVLKDLKNTGIKINAIIDNSRPTTEKNTIVNQNYRLLKIDKLDNRPIDEKILKKIINFIEKSSSKNIIFSDFRHGIFNSQSIPLMNSSVSDFSFKAADSQVASRWGNILEYKDFDLITPNEKEARFALADQDGTVKDIACELNRATNCKNIILKLGEKGIYSLSSSDNEDDSYDFSIDSFCNNLIDPVGAGDALLAYSSLAFINTKSIIASSIIGVIAASLECEYDGNIPITSEDVIKRLDEIEKKTKYLIKT